MGEFVLMAAVRRAVYSDGDSRHIHQKRMIREHTSLLPVQRIPPIKRADEK